MYIHTANTSAFWSTTQILSPTTTSKMSHVGRKVHPVTTALSSNTSVQ